jgi:DNA-binding CsgD family transcriptional regulator
VSDKQDSELPQSLKFESQRLRDLVVLLGALLLQDIALHPPRIAKEDRALNGRYFFRFSRSTIVSISTAAITPRERAVLAQIAAGASSKESARRLGISPRTVEFHRANILRKLGAKNTADLMRVVLAA